MYYITDGAVNADVVIFVEHRDRELEVAVELCSLLENTGVRVAVASSLFHQFSVLANITPKILVTPFTGFGKGSVSELYFRIYGNKLKYVNLNYEQFISSWKGDYKTKLNPLARKYQLQMSWGDFFKEELIANNVPENNIFVTGRPSLSIVKRKYSSGINSEPNKKITSLLEEKNYVSMFFVGLTDGLAFIDETRIDYIVSQGALRQPLLDHIDYVKSNMECLFRDLTEYALSNPDTLIVMRPHPSVSISSYVKIFNKLGISIPNNIYITKDYNAILWLSRADLFITNYSTLCIESKVLDVPTFVYEKIKNVNVEEYWYTDIATKISSFDPGFESFKTDKINGNNFYIDFNKDGIEETAKLVRTLLSDQQSYDKKMSKIILVILSRIRRFLGYKLRNIYVYTGLRPIDNSSRGLIEDFFTYKDVLNIKDK